MNYHHWSVSKPPFIFEDGPIHYLMRELCRQGAIAQKDCKRLILPADGIHLPALNLIVAHENWPIGHRNEADKILGLRRQKSVRMWVWLPGKMESYIGRLMDSELYLGFEFCERAMLGQQEFKHAHETSTDVFSNYAAMLQTELVRRSHL